MWNNKHFSSSFKELSVARNCVRPGSAPLTLIIPGLLRFRALMILNLRTQTQIVHWRMLPWQTYQINLCWYIGTFLVTYWFFAKKASALKTFANRPYCETISNSFGNEAASYGNLVWTSKTCAYLWKLLRINQSTNSYILQT